MRLNIGEKLRRLRLKRNLTQEEMADRCELSKGFISQVERDLASPSIATLTDMLECLGSNLKDFFSETEAEKTVYARSDMFVKEDDGLLRGSITWLVPSAQKNEMEPILVELGEGGQTQEMPPPRGRGIRLCPVRRDRIAHRRQAASGENGGKLQPPSQRRPFHREQRQAKGPIPLGVHPAKFLTHDRRFFPWRSSA